jgi:hypothetical protein
MTAKGHDSFVPRSHSNDVRNNSQETEQIIEKCSSVNDSIIPALTQPFIHSVIPTSSVLAVSF